jgi:hypothetical protein
MFAFQKEESARTCENSDGQAEEQSTVALDLDPENREVTEDRARHHA